MWWCTTTRWYRQHAWEWHHWSVWTTRYDWTMWWVSVVIGQISGGWSHRFCMSFIIIINSSVSINSNQVLISLGNSGLCWTVFARNRDTAVPAEGNGDLQTVSVSLWRDPGDVPHCWILSPDKTEWRLISATLCGWIRCFVADQLWFVTRIREEDVKF